MAKTDSIDWVLPLIYGIVLHVPLYYGVHWFSHTAATAAALGPPPLWFVLGYPLLWATAMTVPGFVAGWFSRVPAFALGAVIGFVASLIEQPVIDMGWTGGQLSWVMIARIAAYALSPAILSAMACAAARHALGAEPQPPPPPAPPPPRKAQARR
jgi:hypothetical protein